MKHTFPYGRNSEMSLEIADEAMLYRHEQDIYRNLTLEELPSAILSALASPLEFPPLEECLLEDDTLVLPVAPGVPHLEIILRAVLQYVFSAPEVHRPAQVIILGTKQDDVFKNLTPERLLEDETYRGRVSIHIHNPAQKEEGALLGVTETNESLVIARTMFDADFVLPIGFFRPKGTPGYVGIHTAVYPLFSDAETLRRYETFGPPVMHATQHELMHQLEHEIAETTRKLGILCMLQLVPGIQERGNSSIARVLVGEYHEVESDGYSMYQEIWTMLSSQRPNVVLATVTGEESTSWRWVMRALENASRIASSEDGIIVLCSDISGELPRSLEIYRQVQSLELAEKFIRREKLPDADLAVAMIRVLTEFRVFFLSQVEGETLEDINIMPIATPEELERLIANNGTCTFLPDVEKMIM